MATSLGLGAKQTAAGLAHPFGVPATDTTKVLLIAGTTGMALASVVAGMDRGVKRLSHANLLLALLLLVFVLAAGPTLDLFLGFVASLGHYVAVIGPLSNWLGRGDSDFLHGWTTFFWAWWLSWSPFAGMFIARVSRGHTVRASIGCMVVAPVLLSALWMNAFGATALSHHLEAGEVAAVQAQQPEMALFRMLEMLPLAGLTSVIGIVLVIVFFVTSSDSGSLVIDTITAGGKLDAPIAQRVFWCAFEGIVAITLLLGGGLVALQAAALATGFPIALVLVAMCYSTWKGLRTAAADQRIPHRRSG